MFDLQGKRKLARKGMILSAACGFLLATAAGCGKTEEEGLQIEAIGEERDASKDNAAENGEDASEDNAAENGEDASGDDAAKNGEDAFEDNAAENGGNASEDNAGENAGKDAAQSVGNAEIVGEVKRLSEDSFVISKIETWSEDGASFAASAAPGYEEEESLITVHVAESCAYEYKTVKNGGVNPEDISAREGSFTDLKEKLTVIIKGSWQEDGSFLADHIEMEEFV